MPVFKMNSWITFLHIVLLPCIKEYKAEGTHNGTSRDEECPLGEKHILNISNKQSNIDSSASCFLEKGIYFNIPASASNYAYSCMLLHRSMSQAQRKEFQSQTQVQNHRKAILLLKDHPFEAKIFIDVVSSTRQPIRT